MLRQLWLGKKRRGRTLALLVIVLFVTGVSPFVWHLGKLSRALDEYNFGQTERELAWLQKYGGWLNSLEIVRDAEVWQQLNAGHYDPVKKVLSQSADDKHRLWLMQLELDEGNYEEAEKSLSGVSGEARRALGQGLLELAEGYPGQAQAALERTDVAWQTLTKGEQSLRYLGMAKIGLLTGDDNRVKSGLARAEELTPQNPAYLSVAFDYALAQGEWAKAVELSDQLDQEGSMSDNISYLTKKALLAIEVSDGEKWTESLAQLESLEGAGAYLAYVSAIEALSKGELTAGKQGMERALREGLSGPFARDAQIAWEQTEKRLKAEQGLKPILSGTGE